MVERIRVLLGLRHADDSTPRWLFHINLGALMSVFYFFRWWVGETPASSTGTLLPHENFFLYSASLGLVIWGLSVELTGRILCRIDSNRHNMGRYYQLFASPLMIWLGTLEFSFWLILPGPYFAPVALCCMGLGYVHLLFVITRHLRKSTIQFAPVFAFLAIVPHILFITPFIR